MLILIICNNNFSEFEISNEIIRISGTHIMRGLVVIAYFQIKI